MRISIRARDRAFTFVELMMILGLTLIVGGIAFIILNAGLILFGKNTAMNMAHQQARAAMLEMQAEMHQAVSPAQLTNSDGNPVSGDGPAAGVSFHVFAVGPVWVTENASSTQDK